MVPPSGANKPPLGGVAKKPVVPAIPYNLPHHQPQKQQLSSKSESRDQRKIQTSVSILSSASALNSISPCAPDSNNCSSSGPASEASAPHTGTAASDSSTPSKATISPPVKRRSTLAPKSAPRKFLPHDTNKVVSNGIADAPKKGHRQQLSRSGSKTSPANVPNLAHSDTRPRPHEGNPVKPFTKKYCKNSSNSKNSKRVAHNVDVSALPVNILVRGVNGIGKTSSKLSGPDINSVPLSSTVHSGSSSVNTTHLAMSNADILSDNIATNSTTNISSSTASAWDPHHAIPTNGTNSTNSTNGANGTSNSNGTNGTKRAEPIGDSYHFSRHGPPALMHQSHSSNGNLVFGGLDGSISSPDPPLSAGYGAPPISSFTDTHAPPPGFEVNNAHHRMNSAQKFIGPVPPPMAQPYGPDFAPAAGIDGYGRPVIAAPFEGFPPMPDSFGPDTPHSFHNSPTPGFPDHESGRLETAQPPQRDASPTHFPLHPGYFPLPMMNPPIGDLDPRDGLVEYIVAQFNSPALADCTVEFRFQDSQKPTVQLPGHSLIMFRSPTLKDLLLQSTNPGNRPGNPRHLLLHVTNRHILPATVYLAVQRLYGHPLLPLHPPVSIGTDSADNQMQKFDFALSYTAAGHLIQLGSVVVRGIEIAQQLITWSTLEKAVAFAFEDVALLEAFPGAEDSSPRQIPAYQYGGVTEVLISSITDFIIQNWPRDFVLDTSPAKVAGFYDRVPHINLDQKTQTYSSPPPIARGTRSSKLSQSLSNIQFGDVNNPAFAETPQPQPARESVILSRILLNLPFTVLKFILESMAMAHQSQDERIKIVEQIIAEREIRRMRVVQQVHAGKLNGSAEIRMWLEQGGSFAFGSPVWATWGWKEDVTRYDTGLPCLQRLWYWKNHIIKAHGSSSAASTPV